MNGRDRSELSLSVVWYWILITYSLPLPLWLIIDLDLTVFDWSVFHMLQHHVSPPHVVFPEWYFWLSLTDFSYRFCDSTCCTTCTCAISDSKLCLMFVSERAEHSPTYISDSRMTFSSISWVLTCLDSCKSHLLAIRQIYTCSFELSLSCYSQ